LNGAAIRSALQDEDARNILVGMETVNTGLFHQRTNHSAQILNASIGLSPTGSSDSHVFWTIGLGYTTFPGRTSEDLRQALMTKTTTAQSLLDHRSVRYWASHVFHRMLRKLGWATWAAEPNANLVLRRLADVQS
jgi:hypothetical protein